MRINSITSNYSYKGVRVSDDLSGFMKDLSESHNPKYTQIADNFEKTCELFKSFPYSIYLDFAQKNSKGISVGLENKGDIIELRSYPYVDPKPKQVYKNCYKDLEKLILGKGKHKAEAVVAKL